MSASSLTNRRYVGVKENLAYGVACGGQNMSYTFMASYLTYFFVNVFGIDPAIVATMLFIEGIWDAVNDPIMGSIVDKTRTRFGKLRPYLLVIPIPLAVVTMLLFAGPVLMAESSMGAKVAYMVVTYFVWEFLYTICDVPLWGMSAAISPNPEDRTRAISSARFTASILGGLPGIVLPILIDLINAGSVNISLQKVFFVIGIIVSFVGMGLFSLAGICTRERVAQSLEEPSLLDSFKYLFQNKPLMLLIAYNVLNGLTGISGIFQNYYFIDVLGSASINIVIGIPGTVIGFAAYLMIGPLKKRFNNKQIVITMTVICGILPAITFILGYNNMKSMAVMVPLLMLQGSLNALFNGVRMVIPTEMIGDTVDYMEWKTGKRSEGMSFSILTFISKFTGAMSRSMGTALLTAIGYVTSSTNAIVPQSMHTQKGIFAMFTIIPGLLGIIGIIPLFFYDLVGEKQKKILKELAERREKAEKREEEKIVEADTQA